MPSEDRSAPQAPSHLQSDLANNPESLSNPLHVEESASPAQRKLLPRETGHDIGMGSPVPLSAEAVSVITNLRNMKVGSLLLP